MMLAVGEGYALGMVVMVVVGFVLYFLPALIANGRHKHATAIAVLNLFLGWTLIGWVGALVWALIPTPPEAVSRGVDATPPTDSSQWQ